MKYRVLFLICCLSIFGSLQVQTDENHLLLDKPGTFKLNKEALNGQGPDLYKKACSCCKAESDAMLKKLEKLVELFRQTPVVADK